MPDNVPPGLSALIEAITPVRHQVSAHPMYAALGTLEQVRCFQTRHVFAVWDFMSLLKRLQRELTCVEVPWMPVGERRMRRFINEIVLEEESGPDGRGGHCSHFELYHAGMRQSGADTTAIDRFVARIADGADVEAALAPESIPESVRAFVRTTWSLAAEAPLHCAAAAFTMAREDLIPDMFHHLLGELSHVAPGKLEILRDYFELHIEVDGEDHGPMALQLLAGLCGDDTVKWEEAEDAASGSLRARSVLWDGVLAAVGGPGAESATSHRARAGHP